MGYHAHSRLVGRCLVAGVVVIALAGCGLPRDEPRLSPAKVADALRRHLDFDVARVPPVDTTAAFPDVEATYVGRAHGERILVVVFCCAEAATQLLGRSPPRLSAVQAVRERNVVVLYTHEPRRRSRAARLSALLRRITPSD